MSQFYLDEQSYNQMLNLLNNLHFTDRFGKENDLNFLSEDGWLADAAVIDKVIRKNGTWEIHLLFVHYLFPCRFIKRFITQNNYPLKVEKMASIMRRAAAKDQRGTLEVDIKSFNFCAN